MNCCASLHIAVDNGGLGVCLHAPQPQPERRWAFVHHAILSLARVFRMLHHRQIDLRRQTQSFTHHGLVEDGPAVIAHRYRTRPLQPAKVGQHRAFAGLGRGRDGKHVDHRPALRLQHPGDPLG